MGKVCIKVDVITRCEPPPYVTPVAELDVRPSGANRVAPLGTEWE
jgi:hypothetical protein